MPKIEHLLRPLKMGEFILPNRILMASLTRQRCFNNSFIPNELMVEHYGQRAQAGLIITESVPISERAIGFPGQPAIFNQEQIEGWIKVLQNVHNKGGRMFAQIWHPGRATHSTFLNGLQPWAPSAIAPRSKVRRTQLMHEIPHQMTEDEIILLIQQYKQAAIKCQKAGFDGIELHSGTGYLLDQYLKDSSNKRVDQYGGSIENRCRLCLQILDELIPIYGNGRIGVKISPISRVNDMCDSDPISLYTYLINEFNKRNIAFIEIRDENDKENHSNYGYPSSKSQIADVYQTFRPLFKGAMIGNNGFTPENSEQAIKEGKIDAVSFGKLFISNPDLVERITKGYQLNYQWDENTFYTQGEKGYNDYPIYQQQVQQ